MGLFDKLYYILKLFYRKRSAFRTCYPVRLAVRLPVTRNSWARQVTLALSTTAPVRLPSSTPKKQLSSSKQTATSEAASKKPKPPSFQLGPRAWQPKKMKPVIAIPATLLLVARAYSKKSLTPSGIVAAAITAAAHAYHPWNLPFVLLCVFFLAGTRVTHVCIAGRESGREACVCMLTADCLAD